MTNEEAIKRLTDILDEVLEDKNAICYVTNYDEEPLKMAIKALKENEKLKAEVEKWKSYFEKEIENEC